MGLFPGSNSTPGGRNGRLALRALCPFRPSTVTKQRTCSTTVDSEDDDRLSDALSTPRADDFPLDNIVAAVRKQKKNRTADECQGKKLLIGEVRLDRCVPGCVYKIAVRGERLPPKSEPRWTVWLELPVQDTVDIEVLARDNSCEDEEAFETVASLTSRPLDFFTAASVDFASARVPTGWTRGPDMAVVLEMRLEVDASKMGAELGPVKTSTRCCAVRKKVHVLNRRDSSDRMALLFGKGTMQKIPPLTDVEVVIVKDTYNKALAWVDMILEFIVERLFFLVPTLPDILGELAPQLQRYVHGILDLAVRSLDPSTEDISREAYQAVHPNPSRPHQNVAGYLQALAEQGFLLTHGEILRDLWMDALRSSPYMEAYELQNMDLGTDSAAYRFFTLHVLHPLTAAIHEMNAFYDDASNATMVKNSWAPYSNNAKAKWALGVEFYERLFSRFPDLVPLFRAVDMDAMSRHLAESLEIVVKSFGDMWTIMPILRQLGLHHLNHGIPSSAHDKIGEIVMEILGEKLDGFTGEGESSQRLRELWGKAWERTAVQVRRPMDNAEQLVSKAYEWIDQAAHELSWDEGYTKTRKGNIYSEVINRGTYSHTAEELVHGARVCWRNSAKCIGRIAWKTLTVRDKRHVTDLGEMFAECMEHQRLAMSDGSIKSVMTVFRPQAPGERMGTRFWNSQLTRYAAYKMDDGSIIGDGANLELTDTIIKNGWVPPHPRGHFDVLPVVIETPDSEIKMFDVPPQYCREIPLEHPSFPAFAKLGLKWAAVPSISNFTMNLGGINYTACPFNGWFMNTEVGRDLMEDGRCGRSLDIAASFGIKISQEDPFWKDRTFLELNYAVVHSFRKAGASIVDHHTASQQFLTHDLREKRLGRECPAQWSWIVPPLGGSLTSVFHHEMRHFEKDPRFVYQASVFDVKRSEHAPVSDAGAASLGVSERKKVLVLYGSETGTAEGFAYETAARLAHFFTCHVSPLDDVEPADLAKSAIHAVLVVLSTFGDGGMPQGAKVFYEKVQGLGPRSLAGVRFSLMALGSSAYPDYCSAGKKMDKLWHRLGAERLCKIQLGNELDGQARSVREWQTMLEPVLGTGPTQALKGTADGGLPSAATVELLENDSPEVRNALDHPNFIRKGFSLCTIASNEELLKPATRLRSTRSVDIDISGEPSLRYETGDHASVIPSNDSSAVVGMLKYIKATPAQWFTLKNNARPPFPVPTTIARAFMHELDLATREPIDGLLELLLRKASKESEKRRLEALLESRDTPAWTKTQTKFLKQHTSILSALQAFPSASVKAQDLLLTLPLIKPRYYSISSASEVHPQRLELTVGVLKVLHNEEGTVREGLCSNFLARRSQGDLVRVAVRTSSFRAPADLASSPVIMVGPGTGISPMLAFLEAREAALREGATLAPCLVYFGCRDSTEMLHSGRLLEWYCMGVMTGLFVATSREGAQTYVQHLIAKNPDTVWELLRDPKCHVYVCGDSSMGDEVKAEMMFAALRCSSMDRLGVVDFFASMKQQGRLQSDTWGVGLHGPAAVDTFLAKQEGQQGWQAQVRAAKSLQSAASLVSPASVAPGPLASVLQALKKIAIAGTQQEEPSRRPDCSGRSIACGGGNNGGNGSGSGRGFLRRSSSCIGVCPVRVGMGECMSSHDAADVDLGLPTE